MWWTGRGLGSVPPQRGLPRTDHLRLENLLPRRGDASGGATRAKGLGESGAELGTPVSGTDCGLRVPTVEELWELAFGRGLQRTDHDQQNLPSTGEPATPSTPRRAKISGPFLSASPDLRNSTFATTGRPPHTQGASSARRCLSENDAKKETSSDIQEGAK